MSNPAPPDMQPYTIGDSVLRTAALLADIREHPPEPPVPLPEAAPRQRGRAITALARLIGPQEVQAVVPDPVHTQQVQLHEQSVSRQESSVRHGLQLIRQRVGNPAINNTYAFNRYFSSNVPSHLQTMYSGSQSASWKTFLAENANDEQLLEVLTWHRDGMHELWQSPEIAAAVTETKRQYTSGVRRGIQEGWLSPRVQATIEKDVDGLHVKVVDPLDVALTHPELLTDNSGESGEAWYEHTHANVVNVLPVHQTDPHQRVAQTATRIRHRGPHEFNHAILQSHNSWTTTPKYQWLVEAMAEHTRLSLKNGRHDIIDPTQRKLVAEEPDAIYFVERQVLALICRDLDDPGLATRAYSGDLDDWNAFNKAVDGVLGEDKALEKISDELVKAGITDGSKAPLRMLLGDLTAKLAPVDEL